MKPFARINLSAAALRRDSRLIPRARGEREMLPMWKCCQVQIQIPMKGAGVGEEKSHIQDDVRR